MEYRGNNNMLLFYTGPGYCDNTAENIAELARKCFKSCAGKSLDEIKAFHLFWATDGPLYKGAYNGDTYVLFDDVEKLPEGIRLDAYANCKGLRRAAERA